MLLKLTSRGRRAKAGFSLVEMLIVLVIIGLIVGLVAPNLFKLYSNARERAADLQIKSLQSALELYFIDAGQYPSDSEGLNALVRKPPGTARWNGPYIKQPEVPLDPWGRQYRYRLTPNGPQITSQGPEGRNDAIPGQGPPGR